VLIKGKPQPAASHLAVQVSGLASHKIRAPADYLAAHWRCVDALGIERRVPALY
jgi:hypothetical protein